MQCKTLVKNDMQAPLQHGIPKRKDMLMLDYNAYFALAKTLN